MTTDTQTEVVGFNNVEIPEFLRVTGISFPVTPELTLKEAEVPRRYGNVDNGVSFGGKPSFTVTCVAMIPEGSNIHDLADEFKTWLRGDNWAPSRLTFGEQPDKYVMARVASAVSMTDLFLHGETEVEFSAADPIKYASEISSKSFTGSQEQIPYTGIEKAPTLIEIDLKGNAGRITVRHEPSFKAADIVGTLKEGQKVTIDSDRKLIQIDGTTDMTLLTFESQWLFMEHGTNVFTVESDTNIETETTVSYRTAD